MRIALASAELFPLGGGGIGQFASAAARTLAEVAEVTVLTGAAHRTAYERLRARDDPRLPPASVRIAFVEEPDPDPEECEGFFSPAHLYSARIWQKLLELYPDGGPDLIELPDFLGEGCVTAQAAGTLDPFLENTLVCVRMHTAAEICEVLNGVAPRDFPTRATFGLERLALREVDRVLWAGGDVLGTYRRFYAAHPARSGEFFAHSTTYSPLGAGFGRSGARRIRHPYHGPAADPEADRRFRPGEPLRLLYAGRLERRKGVANLLRAASGLDRDDFRLTLVGADTPTGPLGVSMRDQLLLAAADDERIAIGEALPREQLADLVRDHDVVVMPSLWECWPYAALEALHLNRPLLATPVGGLAEMVVPGQSGWLTPGSDPESLAAGLERLLDSRTELEAMVREGRPAERARSLADPAEITDAYRALAAERRPRRVATSSRIGRGKRHSADQPPLVSAVVPYHQSAGFVADTVASLLAQTYPRLEIILINDGSFEEADWVVAELAARHPIQVITQPNSGLGAARNFGIRQSRGRYVFPLDADNAAEPGFVERCVGVLEARPELAYVTCWSAYVDAEGRPRDSGERGFQPLGGDYGSGSNLIHNVSGDAAALIRRRVFDLGFSYSEELTSYEDWHLYRELEAAGHLGAVIPERLIRYRVHTEQMTRQVAMSYRLRIEGEIEARMRESEMSWAAEA